MTARLLVCGGDLWGVCLGLESLEKVAWLFSVGAGSLASRAHPLVGEAPSLPIAKSPRSRGMFTLSPLEGGQRAGGCAGWAGVNEEDKSQGVK